MIEKVPVITNDDFLSGCQSLYEMLDLNFGYVSMRMGFKGRSAMYKVNREEFSKLLLSVGFYEWVGKGFSLPSGQIFMLKDRVCPIAVTGIGQTSCRVDYLGAVFPQWDLIINEFNVDPVHKHLTRLNFSEYGYRINIHSDVIPESLNFEKGNFIASSGITIYNSPLNISFHKSNLGPSFNYLTLTEVKE